MKRNRPGIRSSMVTVAALLILSGKGIVSAQERVVGYYPMWRSMPLESIRFNTLTHLVHAFALANADGSIAIPVVDTALINTAHRAGRKILLSFGGAGGAQTLNFSKVAADSALRSLFARNASALLFCYGYDGADVDWEGPQSASDRVNQVVLLRELRAAFDAVDRSLLITMAVGVTDWSGQWMDFPGLLPYVDWFNAMTYDFYGGWSSTTGHNAALYATAGNPGLSCAEGIRYLNVSRTVPKNKLVLGLPFYGKRFTGTASLGAKFTGETDLAYADIVSLTGNGWSYHWDLSSGVPYLSNSGLPGLITFDDSASLSLKCRYARDAGLAGIMIWEITQDVLPAGQPLMDALALAMSPASAVLMEPGAAATTGFSLLENYPNPFNPGTHIVYRLDRGGSTSLRVYDVLGRLSSTVIENELQSAGTYSVYVDLDGKASGVYIAVLKQGGRSFSHPMVHMR